MKFVIEYFRRNENEFIMVLRLYRYNQKVSVKKNISDKIFKE